MLSYDRNNKQLKAVWKYAQADFERANELLSDIGADDMENNIIVQMDYKIHGCNEGVHHRH